MRFIPFLLSDGLFLLMLFIGFGVALLHVTMAHVQGDMVIFMPLLYGGAVAVAVIQPFWIPLAALAVAITIFAYVPKPPAPEDLFASDPDNRLDHNPNISMEVKFASLMRRRGKFATFARISLWIVLLMIAVHFFEMYSGHQLLTWIAVFLRSILH